MRLSTSFTSILYLVIQNAKVPKINDDLAERSKLNKKDQNRSNDFNYFKNISDLCQKTMEKKKWIKTEQMLEALKNDPNNEQEYTHYLGGFSVPLVGSNTIKKRNSLVILPTGVNMTGTQKQNF